MKNDAMFSVRIPLEMADMICKIGNGSRSAGLKKLYWCYTDSTDERLKQAYDYIKDLESAIEDRRHIIKKQREIIEKLDPLPKD
jgi:hypothetical protein